LLIRILSSVLLTCSAVLLFGEFRTTSRSLTYGAGYLSNDQHTIDLVGSRVAAGSIGWSAAAAAYRETIQRDPASPQRWCELGEALAKSGDLATAEYCYLRGGALGPHSPPILLDVGDFYFLTSRYRLALPWFAKLLQTIHDPNLGYIQNVFEYYESMGVQSKGWLDDAVPDAESARNYLTYMIASPRPRPLSALWEWADRRGFTNDDITVRYTDYLLHKPEMDSAEQVWMKHFSGRGYACVQPSCVFNGDFEHEFTGGAFDWRFEGGNGVKVERDPITRYEGQYSLRIDFSANDNPDFHHVVERIAVRPGHYRLEGYVRSSGMTSDQGIRLRIYGAITAKNMEAETAAVIGTESWKRVDTEFEVPEKTRELEVRIARRKSLRLDNQFTGTAWIDSLRLIRLR
jgi:tetratricopeptide (TPR) repeat protein